MPGSADRNLRRAAYQEDLGILALSAFCAVAQVRREQDVGVDVVCTLLRPDGNRRLFAEESFYVQLKAESVARIRYERHEAHWVRSLQLPLFIGRVSISKGVRLYATHALTRTMIENDYDSYEILLDPVDQKRPPPPDTRMLGVGPPVLEWRPEDAADDALLRNSYEVMKSWIALENSNRALRVLRMFKQPPGGLLFGQWETNVPLHPGGSLMMMGGGGKDGDVAAFVEQLLAPTLALGVECARTQRSEELSEVLRFVEVLIALGADPVYFRPLRLVAAIVRRPPPDPASG